MEPPSEIQSELDKAPQARARGNEGQARVCARRPAGTAARAYFERLGKPILSSSAYDLLKAIAEDQAISAHLRESAVYLTLRVDEQFKLPPGVDLLAEAKKFCESLRDEA